MSHDSITERCPGCGDDIWSLATYHTTCGWSAQGRTARAVNESARAAWLALVGLILVLAAAWFLRAC